MGTMRAWRVGRPGPIDDGPLERVEIEIPEPGPGEVLIRVSCCGVCRTDLHLAEGDLAPRRPGVVPGHEVVGTVERCGEGCTRFAPGQRVGVAWLASSCGACSFCRSGRENLCVAPRFTGWDLDGGFAEYLVAEEAFVYALPERFSDLSAAPLLCAGIIGYRALARARLPEAGRLGIWGFGASAHLTAQLALAKGASLYVCTRSEPDRLLATELGATWVGGSLDAPPELLDAAILFAPVGTLVPVALGALDRGGTLAVAGIYVSEIPPLDYDQQLFNERTLTSVTANTRSDGAAFLADADRFGLAVTTRAYDFEAADRALSDLAHDRFSGAAVLRVAD